MPPKNTIELASGCLYFKGLDEPAEIYNGEVTYETKCSDEQEPYIPCVRDSLSLTLEDVEVPREWVMAECKDCGYQFPVTQFYAILYGTTGWLCPRCNFSRVLREARERSNQ